jgi:urease accessory protein
LGYHAGNLHWRVRFQGEVLFVALEGRLEDYTARLGEMISGRRVGVSILDEEADAGGGKVAAQTSDVPFPAKDHSHHDGR